MSSFQREARAIACAFKAHRLRAAVDALVKERRRRRREREAREEGELGRWLVEQQGRW